MVKRRHAVANLDSDTVGTSSSVEMVADAPTASPSGASGIRRGSDDVTNMSFSTARDKMELLSDDGADGSTQLGVNYDDDGGDSESSSKSKSRLHSGLDDASSIASARCAMVRQTLKRIPNPTHAETNVTARFVHASVVSERLQNNISVADERVFQLAERYVSLHMKQHKALTKQHWKRQEAHIYQTPSFLRRWEIIFDQPLMTSAGRAIVVVEACLALWTALQLMLETLPQYNVDVNPAMEPTWFVLELINTVLFIVLAISRFVVLSRKTEYFKNGMNYVDILSISPFFIQLAVNNRKYIVLKALRIARLVRPFRGFPHVEAINMTLKKIATSLIAPYTLLATSVVIAGSILYWVEGGTYTLNYVNPVTNVTYNNTFLQEDCLCTSTASYDYGNASCPLVPTQFHSIVQAMWFCAVAFTTVGYGDVVPRCIGGKVVTALGLLFSTIFIAMPIAIVGTSFTETVIQQEREQANRKHIKAKSIRQSRLREQLSGVITSRIDRRGGKNTAGSSGATAADGLCRHIASTIGRQTIRLRELAWVPPQGVEVEVQRFHREGAAAARQVASSFVGGAFTTPLLEEKATGDIAIELIESESQTASLHDHVVGRRETHELPVCARFHEHVVSAVDSYVAWLLEYWVCDWLEQQSEHAWLQQGVQSSALPPPPRQQQQNSSFSASTVREMSFARQQQSALAALQRELIPVLAGKHPAVMLVGTHSQPNGFKAQLLLRKRITVELVAIPAASSAAPSSNVMIDAATRAAGEHAAGTRITSVVAQTGSPAGGAGRDRYAAIRGHKLAQSSSSAAARRSAIARSLAAEQGIESGPDGAPATSSSSNHQSLTEFQQVVNLYCEEIIQPRSLGRLEVLEGFTQRIIRFVPYELHLVSHHVNGVSVEEVAARQHILREMAVKTGPPSSNSRSPPSPMGHRVIHQETIDWNSAKGKQLVASAVADIRANSLGCDLHPLAAYASCNPATDPATLHDRAFSCIVEEGDVITFSSLMKLVDDSVASSTTKGDSIEKLAQNYLVACNLPLDSPITAEVRDMLCKSRASQLARLGIRPLSYRVSVGGGSSEKGRAESTTGSANALDEASRLLEQILGETSDEKQSETTKDLEESAALAAKATPRRRGEMLSSPAMKPSDQADGGGSPSLGRSTTPLRSALKKSSPTMSFGRSAGGPSTRFL